MEVLVRRQNHIKESWTGIYECCHCGSTLKIFGSNLTLCQLGIPQRNERKPLAFKCKVCGMGNVVSNVPSYLDKTVDGFIDAVIVGTATVVPTVDLEKK